MKAGVLAALARVLTLHLASCAEKQDLGIQTQALPAGVLAQVAGRPISVDMVVGNQGLSVEQAAEEVIRRELLVALVTADQPERARVAERTSLARALLDDLRARAEREGPVRDEEVAEVVQMRWTELNRPRAVRTAHAAALPKSPEDRSAAKQLAERIAEAVGGVTDPDEFADRARAVASESGIQGVDVRVEALPPVARDGRTVPVDLLDQGGPPSLVAEYAEAAQRLQAVGEQSPPIETNYGWHVLLATAVYPELRPNPEDVRPFVEAEVLSLRARPLREQLTSSLRASTSVEIARNASELTRSIWDSR